MTFRVVIVEGKSSTIFCNSDTNTHTGQYDMCNIQNVEHGNTNLYITSYESFQLKYSKSGINKVSQI